VETKQSEPALFKEMRKNEPKDMKKMESKAATAPLPTKSWTALLKEAPMNPDAKPFKPAHQQGRQRYEITSQSPKLPPGLEPPVSQPPGLEPQGKLSIDLISADKDDPEWMQYLSKKLQHQGAAKSAAAGPPPIYSGKDLNWNPYGCSNRPIADRLRSNQAASDMNAPDSNVANSAGAAPVSSLVIHTEEYLKILKDGKPKSRGGQSTNNGSVGGKGKLGKGKNSLGGSLNIRRLPGETDAGGPGLGLDLSMPPMTASGLARKWASAIKTDPALENAPEEDVPGPVTMDDIEIEKSLVDQDLSDPAYWSETECVSRKGPSAHLFGRRPRTAKSMIRSYVMQDLSFALDRAVGMLLLRLQRFTDHHRAFKQEGNVHRRFVIGLKEVARRTKQARVDCLIVAPDIEEDADSGGLDDRMRELLASAYQNNIPVIFALSRARLGRALGKSLQISVLGVLDTTGARELMAQCIQLAHDCRQAWLSRVPG